MQILRLVAAFAIATMPAAAFAQTATYTTNKTGIGVLLADPAAKAVLDKYLPGLSSAPKDQLDAIKERSLKSLQESAPDRISDKTIADIGAELAKLPCKACR